MRENIWCNEISSDPRKANRRYCKIPTQKKNLELIFLFHPTHWGRRLRRDGWWRRFEEKGVSRPENWRISGGTENNRAEEKTSIPSFLNVSRTRLLIISWKSKIWTSTFHRMFCQSKISIQYQNVTFEVKSPLFWFQKSSHQGDNMRCKYLDWPHNVMNINDKLT